MRAYRKVDDHYELRIEGGRLVLLGAGAGFVLLLVFLLGLLVGKSLAPPPAPNSAVAEAPREAVAPVPEGQAVQDPPVPAPEQPPAKPELTFYDELKKPDAPPTVPGSSPEARPVSAPPAVGGPTPEPTPEAEPKPALPTPVFTVQVGSFQDRAAADELVRRVGAQGVAAQVVAAPVSGRTWYRVQVGRFETRAEAEAHYRDRLRAKGIQGFVTTR